MFAYYRRHWKPRTLAVNLNYYENNIQPWFKGRPVAGITRRDVLEWFESLHAKPASANRSLPVLSVILRQAEVYGYRPEDSNPCKGCIAPGSLDTSLSHAAGLSDIAVCHA